MREYSTYSDKFSNLNEINRAVCYKPIIFDSLQSGCEEIKYKYIGLLRCWCL